MTAQRHNQFVLIIVVLGLVCSGCVGTGADKYTLLEKTAEKQRSIENLAYIETLTLNIDNETRTVEYDVHLKKPNKFRRIERSGSVIRSEIVSNGDLIWIYDPEKNTVFIRNLTQSEKMPEPAIYTLLTDNITEKYTIGYQETESLNSTRITKMKLVPHGLGTEDATEYLLFWIDSESLIPLKLQSYNEGNPVLTLEYRDYSINTMINNDEFTFSVPYNVTTVYV